MCILRPATLLVLVVAICACGNKDDNQPEHANAPLAPVMKRIDALGIELALSPTWKPGGPASAGPNEAQFFRGSSAETPDAAFLISHQDIDMSDDDNDQFLFTTKQIGGQIVRAGGTCAVIDLGGRSVGRCELLGAPLQKWIYAVPEGSSTYSFLFMVHNGGPAAAQEASSIVSSMRKVN